MATTTIVVQAYQLPEGDCNRFYAPRAPHSDADVDFDNSVDDLGPGGILGVEGGDYSGQLAVKNSVAGAAQPLVIRNLGGQARFLTVADDNPLRNNDGLELDGSGHGGTTYGFYFRRRIFIWAAAAEGNTDIEVHHCEVDDAQGSERGITAIPINADVEWTDIAVHHNYIHDCGAEAIYLGDNDWAVNGYDMQNITAYNNLIRDCGEGIQLGSAVSGSAVYDNDIADIDIGVLAALEGGIIINPGTGSTSVAEIYNNKIFNSGGWGIYLSGGGLDLDVYNNLIINTGTGSQAGRKEGIENSSAGDVNIVNNTICTSPEYGIYNSASAINTFVFNNVFLDHTTGSIRQGGVPGGNIYTNSLQESGYTLANFDFVDYLNDDYHIEVTSPAVGAGTNAGAPATDLDGVARGNPPDTGSYEYVP